MQKVLKIPWPLQFQRSDRQNQQIKRNGRQQQQHKTALQKAGRSLKNVFPWLRIKTLNHGFEKSLKMTILIN